MEFTKYFNFLKNSGYIVGSHAIIKNDDLKNPVQVSTNGDFGFMLSIFTSCCYKF